MHLEYICVTPDPVTRPGCQSDLDCANNSSGKTKCDLTNNVCVTPDPVTQPGCHSDLDCANNSSGKTKCDLTNNVCVTPDPVIQTGCQSDLDCANNSSGKTKCDLTNNVCVTPDPVTNDMFKLVISQVYSGGATTDALYDAKFVEIFNPTSESIQLKQASIQYSAKASSDISGICSLPDDITIPEYSYYLVSLTPGATFSSQNADFTCSKMVQAAEKAGKIYIVPSKNQLSSALPQKGEYIDGICYGSGASWYEGEAPTPGLTKKTAAIRKNGGCLDTDNNAKDFDVATPNPRNSYSP